MSSKDLDHYCADQLHILLARPDRKNAKHRKFGNLSRMRQWIEAVYGTLKDQLSLEHHGGRTPAGVITRIARRLLALTATIWPNWKSTHPPDNH